VAEQSHGAHQDEIWDVNDGKEGHVLVVGELGPHKVSDIESEKETTEPVV